LRDVQDPLAEGGLVVSYESIRQWCDTFGPRYAADLRRRRAQPGDKWHCDEMLLKIKGKRYWLGRAVDQDGTVLDLLVQERRDQAAAERFLRQILGSCEYGPRV
jgi:putative transposase